MLAPWASNVAKPGTIEGVVSVSEIPLGPVLSTASDAAVIPWRFTSSPFRVRAPVAVPLASMEEASVRLTVPPVKFTEPKLVPPPPPRLMLFAPALKVATPATLRVEVRLSLIAPAEVSVRLPVLLLMPVKLVALSAIIVTFPPFTVSEPKLMVSAPTVPRVISPASD